jgi:hypothetical protein
MQFNSLCESTTCDVHWNMLIAQLGFGVELSSSGSKSILGQVIVYV